MQLPVKTSLDGALRLLEKLIPLDDSQHAYVAEILLKRPDRPLLVYDLALGELRELSTGDAGSYEEFTIAFGG
ncbi:MAG: hypothetical protein LBK60_06345 [Verrucomicrobiales bacterium]|jgi:hypothetical protein|nr:hypothetical protein [Verrucomicrobiales bacterium]